MIIAVTYDIDKTAYDNPDVRRNIVLTTTEYAYNSKRLVHLQFGGNFCVRLNNLLASKFNCGTELQREQFLLKSENRIVTLSRCVFDEALKQFDMSKTLQTQEVLEEYHYTDKKMQQDMVQIVTTINDNHMSAVIEFKDIEQYNNFAIPTWLNR